MQYRLLHKPNSFFFLIMGVFLLTFLSICMSTSSAIAKPCLPYLGSYDTPGSAQGVSSVGMLLMGLKRSSDHRRLYSLGTTTPG